ncbi:MAG: [FeFe] hydrogenase H-cluster radical SAM maturase HydE [Planctomycetota bacterium]|jgi:biotin synthase|nr:[FeFe] hydrogenase H-cluster radical SAM maturase HydE [Planctomycetota bacterium]
MDLSGILKKAREKRFALTPSEIASLLDVEAGADRADLFEAAYAVKCMYSGRNVSLRGLIEMGNACAKNCLYCGIRRDNAKVERFHLFEDQVVRMAEWAHREGYGSVVIQSGEMESDEHTEFVAAILRRIAGFSGGELGVTLSLGEQREEVYRYWREAGARRYLLRIETSSPELYRRLHPPDHSFHRRVGCLRALRKLGYQVGSGVMSGLPGQTVGHLANDMLFFRDMDIDMIGMGPFVPHPDTPLGEGTTLSARYLSEQLHIGLKMIAVARLYLHDVNIAATTVLQTLAPDGREQGLLAGANVLMPNITDAAYREKYMLYPNKPCIGENAGQCRGCLSLRVTGIGEAILWDQSGDSPHYAARCGNRTGAV